MMWNVDIDVVIRWIGSNDLMCSCRSGRAKAGVYMRWKKGTGACESVRGER